MDNEQIAKRVKIISGMLLKEVLTPPDPKNVEQRKQAVEMEEAITSLIINVLQNLNDIAFNMNDAIRLDREDRQQ